MSEAVIEATNLSLEFLGKTASTLALDDVNLYIEAGEFVSFIGPSGCGKTTLLRVIADLEQPSAGSVKVRGKTPHQARLNREYGYVFQAPGLYPWRTVLKNIELPLEVFGYPKAQRAALAQEYLELVNLKGFENHYPWQLSGGMQQRVSIARALSFKPQLLLMDEPFGALDEFTRSYLNEELVKLWKKTKKTVLFVTHSIPEALYLSTKIVVMSPRPGRVVDVFENPVRLDSIDDLQGHPLYFETAQKIKHKLKH